VKVLVAGAAGFIGSHLVDALLERGDQVVGVDNFVSGSRGNLQEALTSSRFSFLEHDVTLPFDYGDHFELIFHLASIASPPLYLAKPLETLATGSSATKNLLELARRDDAVFVLASTSEVYGDPQEHPQRESYWGHVNPVGERSVYDEAKRFAEAMTAAYHRSYGTRASIVRIFNTFGPRLAIDDGRVISNFIVQALRGEALTVYGNGNQTRSLCYVDDLVGGLIRAGDVAELGPINLGQPGEMTVIEIAERILHLTRSLSTITWHPLPADDPTRRLPDISLARETLNWEPTTSVDQGLQRTIDYFAAQLGLA